MAMNALSRMYGWQAWVMAMGMWMAAPAWAQAGLFPCSGGPNEQMVGMSQSGGASVPLCAAVAPSQQRGNSTGAGAAWANLRPQHAEPPSGWRQQYGAWAQYEVGRKPDGMGIYGYSMSLGHPTKEAAQQAVTADCVQKALSPDPSGGCHSHVLSYAYVVLVHYPDAPFFGSQRGQYVAWSDNVMSSAVTPGFVERAPGQWQFCGDKPRPAEQCGTVVGLWLNGAAEP